MLSMLSEKNQQLNNVKNKFESNLNKEPQSMSDACVSIKTPSTTQAKNENEITPTYTILEVIGPSNFLQPEETLRNNVPQKEKIDNGISEDKFYLNEEQESMLDVSESNANPSKTNEEDESTLIYTTLEAFVPSNFEELIEVENDPVRNEIDKF